MAEQRSRILWVDTVKCICIIAVIFQHTATLTGMADFFIGPFLLNAFSFASGYTYFHKKGFGSFFAKKVRQLLIPWFVFVVFIIVSSYLLSFGEHTDIVHDFVLAFLQIRRVGDHMWYIAALFVSYMPFYFFIDAYESSALERRKRNLVFGLIAFALSLLSVTVSALAPHVFPWCIPGYPVQLPWHLEYAFEAMFFLALGYMFRSCWEAGFDRMNGRAAAAALTVVYLLLMFVPVITDMKFTAFTGILISYPRAFAGVGMLVAIAKLINPGRFMRFVGRSTLSYYGLHGKVLSILNTVAAKLAPALWLSMQGGQGLKNVLCSIVFALVTAVILIIPTMILDRFLPFAVGKPFKPIKK